MTKEILQLKNISKVFYSKKGATTAVDNLSFSVSEGEFVAVIGPSGCGKTTVLSLISGLLEPTSGEIVLDSGKKNAVGYMLQQDHLFNWRTVEKNILLPLEIEHNLTASTVSYVNGLLEKYGLNEFKNFYPSEISGGMRQRVALIRTLANSPDLLLLDEPFSALDFQTRLAVCDDVYSIIRKERKTTVLVTHDISEAISVADKIIVLTKRPATKKTEYFPELNHIESPLKRREAKDFAKHFEALYGMLNGETNEK